MMIMVIMMATRTIMMAKAILAKAIRTKSIRAKTIRAKSIRTIAIRAISTIITVINRIVSISECIHSWRGIHTIIASRWNSMWVGALTCTICSILWSSIYWIKKFLHLVFMQSFPILFFSLFLLYICFEINNKFRL